MQHRPTPRDASTAGAAGRPPSECQALWRTKVAEFVSLRDARRQVLQNRTGVPTDVEKFKVVAFDPFGGCCADLTLCGRRSSREGDDRVTCACADPEWSCESRRRLGYANPNFNDGPKWVCGVRTLTSNDCLLMSFGCNNDISFETAIYDARGCEAHVFDPTVTSSIAPRLKKEANGTLHLVGLGAAGGSFSTAAGVYHTQDLHALMATVGVKGRHIDILKVRCAVRLRFRGCIAQASAPHVAVRSTSSGRSGARCPPSSVHWARAS
jgi:hypothetical protein